MKTRALLISVLLMLLALTACTSSVAEPTPTLVSTIEPTEEIPTPTAYTSTPTDEPTSTLAPTETSISYSLHKPTLEEYFDLLASIPADLYRQNFLINELWIVHEDELRTKVSLAALLEAAPYIQSFLYPPVYNTLDEQTWHTLVLDAWLRETPLEFTSVEEVNFDNYSITLTPIDFNGDGENEYLADLFYEAGEYDHHQQTFILVQDTTNTGHYVRLDVPTSYYNSKCDWRSGCGGSGDTWDIQDVTGDGLDDWIFTGKGYAYGFSYAWMDIFGWNGESITSVIGEDHTLSRKIPRDLQTDILEIPPDSWTFENIDDDPALELIQLEHFQYRCEHTIIEHFDWGEDGLLYQVGEEDYEIGDSAYCAFQQAHREMLDHDYPAAIAHYEYTLSFEPTDDVETEAWQYARVRLATLYALNNQIAEAAALLDQLESEEPTSEIVGKMITNAVNTFNEEQSGLALCGALHNTISGDFSYVHYDETKIWYYGQLNPYGISISYVGSDYSPASTGCDVSGVWKKSVASLSTDSPLNMREQLEAQGWSIGGELYADMNGDGIDEWLLWTENIVLGQVLRISDGDTFHYQAFGSLGYDDDLEITFNIFEIPGIDEWAISKYYSESGFYGLYGLNGTEITELARVFMCEPQTIEETFPAPGELHLLTQPEDSTLELPIIRYWDENSRQFVSEEELYPTPTPGFDPTNFDPDDCVGRNRLYNLCVDYDDLDEGIAILDALIATPPRGQDPDFPTALHYIRATMLEQLGEDEAALAEYVAVYEADRESPWGMMAQMHLDG